MAMRAAGDISGMARSQGALLYMAGKALFTWLWMEARSSNYHKPQAIELVLVISVQSQTVCDQGCEDLLQATKSCTVLFAFVSLYFPFCNLQAFESSEHLS